jgi:hypothetical protein
MSAEPSQVLDVCGADWDRFTQIYIQAKRDPGIRNFGMYCERRAALARCMAGIGLSLDMMLADGDEPVTCPKAMEA